MRKTTLVRAAAAAAGLFAGTTAATATPTLTTLIAFQTVPDVNPDAGLAIDAAGNLYGTTPGHLFELTAGTHAYAALASFAFGTYPNNSYPIGAVTVDPAGNVYGGTYAPYRNVFGGVFEVAAGAQQATPLFTYAGATCLRTIAGYGPPAVDSAGDVYGTTVSPMVSQSDGLTPYSFLYKVAAGTHAVTVVTNTDPRYYDTRYGQNVVIGYGGSLYGVASRIYPSTGVGSSYFYKVPTGTATVKPLLTLGGTGPSIGGRLTTDAAGDVYGTADTPGGWTVDKYDPRTNTISTPATVTTTIPNPGGGILVDAVGDLFGTDSNDTVFEIAAGTNRLTTLVTFNGDNGYDLNQGLVADSAGNLYGTTYYGPYDRNSSPAFTGTVFELSGSGFVGAPEPAATVGLAVAGLRLAAGRRRTLARRR